MKHNAKVKHFGRKQGPRKALLRGLVNSLVEHGRIKTTLAKAKELRRHVEKAITTGKKQTLHARRLLLSDFPNEATVNSIISDLSVRFNQRPGGYTRVLKLGQRPGDRAEMAYIQFVDYAPKAKVAKDEKLVKKELIASAKDAAAKKRHIRRLQSKARSVQRENHS